MRATQAGVVCLSPMLSRVGWNHRVGLVSAALIVATGCPLGPTTAAPGAICDPTPLHSGDLVSPVDPTRDYWPASWAGSIDACIEPDKGWRGSMTAGWLDMKSDSFNCVAVWEVESSNPVYDCEFCDVAFEVAYKEPVGATATGQECLDTVILRKTYHWMGLGIDLDGGTDGGPALVVNTYGNGAYEEPGDDFGPGWYVNTEDSYDAEFGNSVVLGEPEWTLHHYRFQQTPQQ